MPIRDVTITLFIVGLLPVCFKHPWVGALAWAWIGYMNPHRHTWTFAFALPFAMMVAIAMMAGLVFTKDKRPMPWGREVWILCAFWAHMGLSTALAVYPAPALDQLVKVSKIFLMTLLPLMVLQSAQRVRWMLYVTALSFGFYGFKGGIFAITTGGAHQVLGPEGSFFSGNTEVGLALDMTLPLLVYLRRTEPRRWLRHFLLVVFALSIIAILITYSRGAFLGLGVVLALLFLKSKSKFVVLLLILAALPIAMSTLPDAWGRRMTTIEYYDEDTSAQGRLKAWQVAKRIADDHPLFGGGFRVFTKEIFEKYGYEIGRDAHSIYFQVLGEHGYAGLLLYLALIGSTLLSLRRLAWSRPRDPTKQWIPECAQMIEASIIAYLVAGAFLSMSYFDYFYGLVALTILLKVLAKQETPAAARGASQALVPRSRMAKA